MINQSRGQARNCGVTAFPAVGPLAWDARIEEAARAHSAYQSQVNTLSHTGAGGSDVGQRLNAAGFAWTSWGENVGWNYPTAQAVFQGWLDSPGHCANLMNANFTMVGWARVGVYDTMDFAIPR